MPQGREVGDDAQKREAALRGNAIAAFNLCIRYANRKGVTSDSPMTTRRGRQPRLSLNEGSENGRPAPLYATLDRAAG
jgi:hypothetical protein